MITSISRWLTKSRLRTALAMLFFAILFLVSISFLVIYRAYEVVPRPYHPSEHVGPNVSGETGSAPEPSRLVPLTGMVTAVGSVIGTVSTMLLAWRADRRTAKESDLKLVQMQQQIKELELKLKGN